VTSGPGHSEPGDIAEESRAQCLSSSPTTSAARYHLHKRSFISQPTYLEFEAKKNVGC
jgi:hypothetical protein